MYTAVLVLALLDAGGFVSLRGIHASGPETWLDGGWGRLGTGNDRTEPVALSRLGIDWSPHENVLVHANGEIRRDALTTRAGVVEAWIEGRAEFGLDQLRVRAGQFFLPTSRENTADLWSSPYTIHFSALNSWIAEEVRPIGADVEYRHVTRHGHTAAVAGTAFRGNDTMGALLAWRGWAAGDRLSTYGEVLPLPPLATLDTFFAAQRDGTQPFGRDLDGRTGLAARVRYSVPERALAQYTFVDNRGDRALHRGEYAWATAFHQLSAQAGDPEHLLVAAEAMQGTTGMGHAPAFVDASFYAAYLLLSAARGRHRWSGRYEIFATEERDFSPAEINDENGRAWTFTWMYEFTERIRVAGEFTQFVGERSGTPDPDARSVAIEARYEF